MKPLNANVAVDLLSFADTLFVGKTLDDISWLELHSSLVMMIVAIIVIVIAIIVIVIVIVIVAILKITMPSIIFIIILDKCAVHKPL